jgi:hypothetical protein
MQLKEFVAHAKAGKIGQGTGFAAHGKIVDGVTAITVTVENLAAEAFNRGIFDPDSVSWEEAISQVAECLAD